MGAWMPAEDSGDQGRRASMFSFTCLYSAFASYHLALASPVDAHSTYSSRDLLKLHARPIRLESLDFIAPISVWPGWKTTDLAFYLKANLSYYQNTNI